MTILLYKYLYIRYIFAEEEYNKNINKKSTMKKKSIQNFKKLENKDLKKVKGGAAGWAYFNGEWHYLVS